MSWTWATLMDKQRLYDAMLIKAFRADATVGHLWWWLKGLGIEIPDNTLKRQPPTKKMRVQSFVGTCLKPLADRLWDTDRSQDIKTLDWMVNLDSQRTGDTNWKRKLQRKVMADRRFTYFLAENADRQNRTNQWGVAKGSGKTRRKK